MSSANPLAQDYFSLFQFPQAFELDTAALSQRYVVLQQQYHPDKHATASEYERRLAMSMSSRINDGYATLKKPLARVIYLLSLHGHEALAEDNTAMSGAFLETQMAWREALMEAEDEAALVALKDEIAKARDEVIEKTQQHLAAEAYAAACEAVRQWVYVEKIWQEVASRAGG